MYSKPVSQLSSRHLADVVQDDAGEQQVAVEDGVMRGDAVGQGEQADHVLQQAAQPGVVELLGGRGFAVGLGERRVGQHGAQQQLKVGVGEALDEAE